MKTTNQNSMASDVGRRLVKTIIAIVGLLIIRLVIGNLPMLKEAKPISVGGNAQAQAVAQYFNTGQLPQDIQQFAAGYIFPISIATAVVDTLIFAVLIGSAAGFNNLIRARSKRLPEGGLIILLLVLTIVVAFAYRSYMGVIPPLLQSQANLYGWIFLILGLLPLIGLIVVASRNLDALTEVIFSSTSRVAVGSVSQTDAAASSATCPKCSATIPAGAKFCGSCGAPVPIPVSTEVFCPGCGTKNEGGAKFCKSCGKPVIA
jgi:hypothetical protein